MNFADSLSSQSWNGTPDKKDYWIQLLSKWPVQGSNPQPRCSQHRALTNCAHPGLPPPTRPGGACGPGRAPSRPPAAAPARDRGSGHEPEARPVTASRARPAGTGRAGTRSGRERCGESGAGAGAGGAVPCSRCARTWRRAPGRWAPSRSSISRCAWRRRRRRGRKRSPADRRRRRGAGPERLPELPPRPLPAPPRPWPGPHGHQALPSDYTGKIVFQGREINGSVVT